MVAAQHTDFTNLRRPQASPDELPMSGIATEPLDEHRAHPEKSLRLRLTLVQLFVLTILVVSLLVGIALYGFSRGVAAAIRERAQALQDAEARRIESRVIEQLETARRVAENLERAMQYGVLAPVDPKTVEAHLFSEILDHRNLSDITFTHATQTGYDINGNAVLNEADRWQVSVFRRTAGEDSEVDTLRVSPEGGRFVAYLRERPPGADLLAREFHRAREATDPTEHPTFRTTSSESVRGEAIWSDLSYSELDALLPAKERRVVVTVQKALRDLKGHFGGVIRVGLLTAKIDELPRMGMTDELRDALVFLCDAQGRLLSRVDPSDSLALFGDDLRVSPKHLLPAAEAALASATLKEVNFDRPVRSASFDLHGIRYLASFRHLANTQEWIVGVVVPEAHYTDDFRSLRGRFTTALLTIMGVVFLGGLYSLRAVGRALGRITRETSKMRNFDFRPSSNDTALRDVSEAIDSLEMAKTAVRALSKYVPVDLVRELYVANREPVLGGGLLEISVMFTDIRGFTSLSERLSPDTLARVLGHYLEAMTDAIVENHGTVDKFIGDAVMAFWNAPARLADHPRHACRGALACMKATSALYRSPAWGDLGPLFTRFGLHRDRVMVGHFGAPDRLSYTALGDGVNLASRLEGLCKQYGVAVLASETIAEAVRDEFEFRLVDRVAVQGKAIAVRIYELLGVRGECDDRRLVISAYERALAAYFLRDFAGALRLLERIDGDGPSRVLVERCRSMLAQPPPPDWDGVYVASTK
jgi:adenylate cyclase